MIKLKKDENEINKEKIEKEILEQNRMFFSNSKNNKLAKNIFIDKSKFENPYYDKVLLFGINPGGDGEVSKDAPDFYFEYFYDKKMCNKLKIDNTSNYMRLNSELFDKIDSRIVWSEFKYEYALEQYKKLDSSMEFLDKFEEMYNAEKKKKGPLLIFTNLFWCHDSDQKNLENELAKVEKNKLLDYVRETLEKNIEYYKPKLIVVANSYAARLVMTSLGETPDVDKLDFKINHRNIPIIFSRTVYPRNRFDGISRERLKSQIKYEWDKVKMRIT